MKKLISMALALVLILSYSMSAFAAGSTVPQPQSTVINQNGFKVEIETKKNSKEYQKFKFTNLKRVK